MSQFDFDTRAQAQALLVTTAGLTAATAGISSAQTPNWPVAIMDGGRLIVAGFDATGAVVTPKVTTNTIADTAAAKYAWSVGDTGRLVAAYIDLQGRAFFGSLACATLTVGGVPFVPTATPPGNPVSTSLWNPDAIRQWRKIANDMRLRGGWGHVAIVADSQYPTLSTNEYVVTGAAGGTGPVLTRLLRDRFGDGGPGFCVVNASQGFNQPDSCASIPAEAAVTVTGTWSDPGAVGWSPNQRAGTTSTAGDTATLAYKGGGTLSLVELHHGGGGGTISYAYNGGTATQVTLPSASGKVTLPAPVTAHRYWRLKYDSTKRGFCGCATLELRVVAGGPSVATGGVAIGGNNTQASKNNAFDGDKTTYWDDPAPGGVGYIGYDFGAGNAAAIVEVGFIGRPDASGYQFSDVDAPQTGGIEYSDDGVNWTRTAAITPPAIYPNGSFTTFANGALNPPPAGSFTCAVKLVSGTMPLAGFFTRKAAGVCVSNLAVCGTAAVGWAGADQAAWTASIGRLGPQAVVFNLAGNDELASRTVAQYVADMATLIGSVRTGAGMATDVMLSYRWASDRGGAVPQALTAYATAMKSQIVGLRAALFDAQQISGAAFAEYTGSAATILAMTQDDRVHASLAGRDVLASGPAALLGALSPNF
jgi:hypothetical protein